MKKLPLNVIPSRQKIDPNDPRLEFLDVNNPRSLVNIVPESMREPIRQLYANYPKLLLQSEHTIKKTVKPDDRDELFRMNFWEEYNRCTISNPPRVMSMIGITKEYLPHQAFIARYVRVRAKLLWLITPPRSYADTMRQLLTKSLDKLIEVVDQPILKKDGSVDHKLVDKIIKIAQMTDLRVKGAIPQTIRTDSRNLNFNVDASRQMPAGVDLQSLIDMPMEDLEEVDARATKLASKVAAQLPGGDRVYDLDIRQPYPINDMPFNTRHDSLTQPEPISPEEYHDDDDSLENAEPDKTRYPYVPSEYHINTDPDEEIDSRMNDLKGDMFGNDAEEG